MKPVSVSEEIRKRNAHQHLYKHTGLTGPGPVLTKHFALLKYSWMMQFHSVSVSARRLPEFYYSLIARLFILLPLFFF